MADGIVFQRIEDRERAIVSVRIHVDPEYDTHSWELTGLIGSIDERHWEWIDIAVSDLIGDSKLVDECLLMAEFIEDGEWHDVFWQGCFRPIKALRIDREGTSNFKIGE